jgi:hypothetical protein
MPLFFSRPEKLDHKDTVLYEIYMLRFTAQELDGRTERDAWVYLEGFLLHYRNLIDFLGNESSRNDDLHVTTIWELMKLKAPADLSELHEEGKRLRKKYEPSNKEGGGRISQYLQHCTEKRVDPKDWFVAEMMAEIEPWLCRVEEQLGASKNAILKPVTYKLVLSPAAASTATGTHTAVTPRLLDDGSTPLGRLK